MSDSAEMAKLRDALIEAALPHIPFDGWTPRALRHAAADAGLDETVAVQAFPGGARDMVAHFSELSDRRMLQTLEGMDLASTGMTERVRRAIRLRLEQAEPHREAIQRTLAFLALPQNAVFGAKLLHRTVDTIWHAAGDTATDWNWYSKRGLLAGVFSATVLYWLNDHSDSHEETWAFLDRRLEDVARIGKATGRLKERVDGITRPSRRYRRARR
ncbi:MAG: COQ9 family protein [Rhodospirillales bacterium]|nr:MAG: COQ9 family protein [Rhodospirillales bacterium]